MLLIPYSWMWLLCIVILLMILIIVYRQRYNGPGWTFLLLIISNVLVAGAEFAIGTAQQQIPDAVIYTAYLGFSTIPVHTMWSIMAIRQSKWQSPIRLTTIYVVIFSAIIILWINPISLQSGDNYAGLRFITLPLYAILMMLTIIISGSGLYQQRSTRQGGLPIFGLILVAGVGIIFSAGSFFTRQPFAMIYQYWLAGYLLSNLFYALAIILHRVLDLKPIALPIIFAEIPDPIFIVDNQQRILDVNKIAHKIWNINLQTTSSPLLADIIPELMQLDPPQPLVVSTHDNLLYFEWSSHPLRQNKSSEGTLYFLRDVTQLHQQSQNLRLARQIADEANNAKSRFLANMSHELRSPLHAMLGFTDLLLLDSDLATHQQQRLDSIRYSGQHLLSVIGDILDIATIEAGKTQLQTNDYDLHRLLYGVRDMYQLQAQQKHIDLRLTIRETVPQYIHGDEAKLRQILVNLVSNAIKFTDKGNIHITVIYTDDLKITITDTGIGIPQEHLETIFSPFYQIENGFVEGTGLGLPICKEYTEKMKGHIQVESMIGQGSTFIITLPIKVINIFQPETSDSDPFNIPNSENHRVLVVDDRDSDREILCAILDRANFSVRSTKGGEETLEFVTSWKPNTAFIDLDMPGMGGREVAQYLKRHHPDIILVAVTAAAHTDISTLYQDGFDQYLFKPLTTNTLLNTLASHIANAPTLEKVTSPTELINQVDLSLCQLLHERAIVLDIQGTQTVIDRIANMGHLEIASLLQNMLDSFHFRQILDMLEYRNKTSQTQ